MQGLRDMALPASLTGQKRQDEENTDDSSDIQDAA